MRGRTSQNLSILQPPCPQSHASIFVWSSRIPRIPNGVDSETKRSFYAIQESNNPYDQYTIAAWKRASVPNPDKVFSHIPNEISRLTWFIIAHGSVVTAQVVSLKHRRSPLIRGGLCSHANSDENKQALDEYTELVNHHYEEPVGENLRDYTNIILAGIRVDNDISSTDESDINKQ